MTLKKQIAIILPILLILFVIYSQNKNPTMGDTTVKNITIKGSYVECLPRNDNFTVDPCPVAIKTKDGLYYVLDFMLMSQTKPELKNDDELTVEGVITPIENLSTNQYQGSVASGIFSVTSISSKPVQPAKPVVTEPVSNSPKPIFTSTPTQGKCFIGGCSSQICSDQPDAVSTCEYREIYACYKTASCERQSNGECGWTQTAELKTCLAPQI